MARPAGTGATMSASYDSVTCVLTSAITLVGGGDAADTGPRSGIAGSVVTRSVIAGSVIAGTATVGGRGLARGGRNGSALVCSTTVNAEDASVSDVPHSLQNF